MTLAYIRRTYSVDARRGGKIEWTDPKGVKHRAKITGHHGGNLRVKFEMVRGKTCAGILHPTDNVRYLEKPAGPKARVLEKWPQAYAGTAMGNWHIQSGEPGAERVLGFGGTAAAAWRDAAGSLK